MSFFVWIQEMKVVFVLTGLCGRLLEIMGTFTNLHGQLPTCCRRDLCGIIVCVLVSVSVYVCSSGTCVFMHWFKRWNWHVMTSLNSKPCSDLWKKYSELPLGGICVAQCCSAIAKLAFVYLFCMSTAIDLQAPTIHIFSLWNHTFYMAFLWGHKSKHTLHSPKYKVHNALQIITQSVDRNNLSESVQLIQIFPKYIQYTVIYSY